MLGVFYIIMEKTCSKCSIEKDVILFRKDCRRDNAYRSICKECERKKEAEYRKANLDKFAKKSREYRKNNPDKARDYDKRAYVKSADRIKEYEASKERKESKKRAIDRLKEKDPEYFARYNRNKRITDKNYTIAQNLRNRVNKALKGVVKSAKTKQLLGCTISELKIHLESKFLPTMSWENYGPLWHIDHIIPCAHFDLIDPTQQEKCFHYSNLQPLFARTTIIDGTTYIGNLEKRDSII